MRAHTKARKLITSEEILIDFLGELVFREEPRVKISRRMKIACHAFEHLQYLEYEEEDHAAVLLHWMLHHVVSDDGTVRLSGPALKFIVAFNEAVMTSSGPCRWKPSSTCSHAF